MNRATVWWCYTEDMLVHAYHVRWLTSEPLTINRALLQEIPKCIQSLCIKIAFVLYRLVPVQPLGLTTCRFPTPMQHKFYPSYNISDVI